jgi:predicted dehydrogenase
VTLKVLLIGLGSIGQRHTGLLQKNFSHQLFALRSGRGSALDIPGVTMLHSWAEVDAVAPEAAFIMNPTALHVAAALECAVRGMHLFIEKPIDCSDQGLDRLIDIVQRRRLTAYVAYPLRFHPVILKLKELCAGRNILHARAVCASYLPDWRPGRDAHTVYSARRADGGGALLDLSHELDYAGYLFGELRSLDGRAGRVSSVTVDAEDYADLLCVYERAAVSIHLNMFSRQTRRSIDIDLDNGGISADLVAGGIRVCIDGKTESLEIPFDRDAMMQAQLEHFFRALDGGALTNDLVTAAALFRKLIAFRERILS